MGYEYTEEDRAKKKLYYARNRKKRLAYQRKWAAENREATRKRYAERKKNDPAWVEARKKYQAEYWAANKDRILARRRELRKLEQDLKAKQKRKK